jgi:hypothetical protein
MAIECVFGAVKVAIVSSLQPRCPSLSNLPGLRRSYPGGTAENYRGQRYRISP